MRGRQHQDARAPGRETRRCVTAPGAKVAGVTVPGAVVRVAALMAAHAAAHTDAGVRILTPASVRRAGGRHAAALCRRLLGAGYLPAGSFFGGLLPLPVAAVMKDSRGLCREPSATISRSKISAVVQSSRIRALRLKLGIAHMW